MRQEGVYATSDNAHEVSCPLGVLPPRETRPPPPFPRPPPPFPRPSRRDNVRKATRPAGKRAEAVVRSGAADEAIRGEVLRGAAWCCVVLRGTAWCEPGAAQTAPDATFYFARARFASLRDARPPRSPRGRRPGAVSVFWRGNSSPVRIWRRFGGSLRHLRPATDANGELTCPFGMSGSRSSLTG